MAEIKIEKKKPIWPWILIIVLVILALLYFLVFADNDADDDFSDTDDMEQVETRDSLEIEGNQENTDTWENEQLNDSLSGGFASLSSAYYAAIEDDDKLGSDSTYTNNALLKLVDAVNAKALEYDLDSNLDQIRKEVMNTSENTKSISSEKIKNTGDKVIEALEELQQKEFPQLSEQIEAAKKSLSAIETDKEMSNQQDEIEAFFDKTADVLRKMD